MRGAPRHPQARGLPRPRQLLHGPGRGTRVRGLRARPAPPAAPASHTSCLSSPPGPRMIAAIVAADNTPQVPPWPHLSPTRSAGVWHRAVCWARWGLEALRVSAEWLTGRGGSWFPLRPARASPGGQGSDGVSLVGSLPCSPAERSPRPSSPQHVTTTLPCSGLCLQAGRGSLEGTGRLCWFPQATASGCPQTSSSAACI